MSYQCDCGQIHGQGKCNWTGPIEEMVTVEFMPDWIRDSHEASGNSGSYPHNGAERYAVSKSCTDSLDLDEEWCQIISAPASRYAEEAEAE